MTLPHDSICTTIGNTPVVRLSRLAPAHVHLYAKLEAFNPMGSVKDRLALGIIEDAERRGTLRPGQTVIEATSGNTGIGLAMVCARKGYPLVVVMAENFSVERRRLMRFLGAKVVLTPAAQKGSGMLSKARELAARHDWFLCRQFENEANAEVHSRTTAPEILAAFADTRLHYFVSGYGTGGTLKGIARVLKRHDPSIHIVACEPDNSPLLGSKLEQKRRDDGSPAFSHPAFRPHAMQGWTPDFISPLTEDARLWIDEIVPVAGTAALRLARELARQEGIFCGISAGATVAAALEIAGRATPGSRILCMLPDTGERYLSTPLFADIEADMDAEEWALSRSTPAARFEQQAPAPLPALAAASTRQQDSPDSIDVLATLAGGQVPPVLLFTLQWCEYCWALRKFFDRLGLPCRLIELDSISLQQSGQGSSMRAALQGLTGCTTIPQVFINGSFVGGCTETFAAWRDGSLKARLADSGLSCCDCADLEPESLLPSWVQRRAG